MQYELKGVGREVVRFLLTLAILGVALLLTIFLSQEWEAKMNQKVVDSGQRIYTKEQLRAVELKLGSKTGLEKKCGQWGCFDENTGRWWKAFPKEKNHD